MSWARRLVGMALGAEDSPEGNLQPLLGSIYVALSQLSRQVEAHAQMAPTVPLEAELGKLGHDIAGQAERIATLLAARQLVPPSLKGESIPRTQPSHWARLVQDLEHLRETRRQLLDAYAEVNEVAPALAAEIEDCGHQVDNYLHRLRSLIARADPQALN